MPPDSASDLNPLQETESARVAAVEALKARLEVEEEAERSRLRAEEARQALLEAEATAERARDAAREAEQAQLAAEGEAERLRLAGEEALQDWRAALAAEATEPTRPEPAPEVEAARTGLQEVLDEQVLDRTTEPAADVDDTPEPTLQPSPARQLTCVVSYWREYRKATFYARAFDSEGHELVVAESPQFRARGNGIPDRTEQAVAAYDDLVAQLAGDGWEPIGRGDTWFGQTFRRRVTAAAE